MIGKIVGEYRVTERLGEGGMGVVYRCEHKLLGRPAALKMLHPKLCENEEIVQRFFNEAKAASAINHPGIVEIYTFGYDEDGSAYIVMAYLEGENLEERASRRGRLPVAASLRIGRQVASALAAAHAEAIVHRDLKPDNVFLVRDPDVEGGERIRLLDFGIAKLAGDPGAGLQTRTGAVMGTPAYMAPEQCEGAGNVDHRADLYAVGCILYRILCGRVPFEGAGTGAVIAAQLRDPPPPPRELVPDLPAPVEELLLRLLEKTPDRRYPDAESLREALTSLAAGAATVEAPSARPLGTTLPGAAPAPASTGGALEPTQPPSEASAPARSEAQSSPEPARHTARANLPDPPASPPAGASPETTLGAAAGAAAPETAPPGANRLRLALLAGAGGLAAVGAALWIVLGSGGGESAAPPPSPEGDEVAISAAGELDAPPAVNSDASAREPEPLAPADGGAAPEGESETDEEPEGESLSPTEAARRARAAHERGERLLVAVGDVVRPGRDPERLRAAVKAQSEALALDPSLADAYRARGLAYEKLGRMTRACRDYKAYIERRPGAAKARRLKRRIAARCDPAGSGTRSQEKRRGAPGAQEETAAEDGSSAATLTKKAQSAMKRSEAGRALRLCEAALEKQPKNQQATMVCALASCRLKSEVKARRYIDQIRSAGRKSMARQICLREGITPD